MRLLNLGRGGLSLLAERNFGIFAIGYGTSYLCSQMAGLALTFAVLGTGGSVSDLGLVMTARILPLTLFLLGGGVIGDRFPRRYVLIVADSLRLVGQLGLVAYTVVGTNRLWVVLALSALVGLSEALFQPAFEGLIPSLTSADRLHDANTLIGLTKSTGTVAGPALAGVLVAVGGPAIGLAAGAFGYAVSVVALLLLRLPSTTVRRKEPFSLVRELRLGWAVFRSYTWLWTITLQFTMFNLLVWAPFLVLGPVSANQSYGGAGAWGSIMAAYGFGALVAGLAILGRRPTRPLVVATIATIGWAAPSAALAAHAPIGVVVAAAFVAGCVNATFNALFSTAVQRSVPTDTLSRMRSYIAVGAFSMGPIGLSLTGPVAKATSIRTVLTVGVVWQLLASAVLLTVPAIRHYHDKRAAQPAESGDNTDVATGAVRA